ncbi:maestro heat-like repeat family member 5 isoform X2 [Paroedura picta]
MLLAFSTQEEEDRVGISEVVGLTASCHLREILIVLRDYGNMMRARRSLTLEKTSEDQKTRVAIQVRITLIQCYGHAAAGAQTEDLLLLIEFIISEMLIQFHAGHKDELLKKTFMKSVVMVSRALQESQREEVLCPRKTEIVLCIIEVIEEEPQGSVCFTILHLAMTTICSITLLKPVLDFEVKSDLVCKSIRKVYSLPALKVTKLKAGSPTQPTQTQDFYQQTMSACNSMLTSLLSEMPNMDGLQEILIHTNSWMESEKTYERERAVRSTIHVLKFAAEHLDFDVSQEFSLLGQLVAVLGMRTMDSVKEIGLQAAEAIYHLHYLTMSKMVKEMEKRHKNKKGNIVKWMREDFFISGPSVFYNNISKVAKAFGEHLSPNQVTELVLKIIGNLMHEDRLISQAASALLSSFLEECGMDVEDLPLIVKDIYTRLSTIHDAVTKEETMKAMCSLASKRVNGVVDCLLEVSTECDNNAMELWKALVSDPYSNAKLVRPLLKRLQDEDPLSENCNRRNSKSHMPLAATNALRWILTLPDAVEVVQGKFPHLLIALVTQIYYTLGSSRKGSRKSNTSEASEPPGALNSGVQALKNLITCMGYYKEYNILGMQNTWDKLQQADNFFEGVFQLVRVLFTFTNVHMKMTFKQANAYLRRLELKERTVGMAFFTELLFHGDIGLMFVKQDILDVLREWMVQPCPLMQLFSIRGLGHLLQHPLEDESLEALLPPLMSCAFDLDKTIVKETIKTLRAVFEHIHVEEYNSLGVTLIPTMLQYFSDEDDDLRSNSIRLFGTFLKGAAVSDGNRHSLKEEIFRSQVPLLIQLADPVTREASRNVLSTCTTFLKWTDVPAGLFGLENCPNIGELYRNLCKYLLRKYKNKTAEILAQTVSFLKSKLTLHREAAAILIGIYAPHLTADVVSSKDIEEAYLAVRELQGDCEDSVSTAAVTAIEQLFQHCRNRISRHLIPHQVMPLHKSNLDKRSLEERK